MRDLIFPVMLLLLSSCEGQNKKPKDEHLVQTKGTNPKEEVKVNKTYDKKGNLIRYDSAYSYQYTSKGLDSSKMKLDTMLRKFKDLSDKDLNKMWDQQFKDLFMTDSLFKYDLPNEDYFSKRFELNLERMRKMMSEMDSLKTSDLKKNARSTRPIKK